MLILNETEANNHALMITKTQMKTNITTSFFISSLYIPLENKILIFVLYTHQSEQSVFNLVCNGI